MKDSNKPIRKECGELIFEDSLRFEKLGIYELAIKELIDSDKKDRIDCDRPVYKLIIEAEEEESRIINLKDTNLIIKFLKIVFSTIEKLDNGPHTEAHELLRKMLRSSREYDPSDLSIIMLTNVYEPLELKAFKSSMDHGILAGAKFEMKNNGKVCESNTEGSFMNEQAISFFSMGDLKVGDEIVLTEIKALEGYLEVGLCAFTVQMENDWLKLKEKRLPRRSPLS